MKQVTDASLLEQLNASGPVTDPEVLAQLNGGGSTLDQRQSLRKAAQKAELDKELAGSYSGGKGVVANFGAGMDNVLQGAKGLFGFGRDDATIHEDRALKKRLGDSTLGGGAIQTAGEMTASAPITMGVGGALAKGGGVLFPKAAQWATKAGSRYFNPAIAGRAATEGAVGGAFQETTEDESRAANTVLGAGVGGALPSALAVGSRLAKAVAKGSAPLRAANVFEKQLGKDSVANINEAIDAPKMTSLPLSTASEAQDVGLAALERGARGRSDWGYDHDRKVAEKAWGLIKSATGDADQLGARTADLDSMMKATRDHLSTLKGVGPKTLDKATGALSEEAQALRTTAAARQNPELTNLIGEVEAMLSHPQRTPADYAEQWFRLDKKIASSGLPDEAKVVMGQLKDAVGKSADIASRGGFSGMLGRMAAETEGIAQSTASKGVRETFQSEGGTPVTTRHWQGTPEVSSSALRKTMAGKGLAPEAQTGLGQVEKELGQHELFQPRNAPGPSGLGIDNPLGVVSSGRDNPFNFLPLVKGSANWLFHGSRKATTEAADAAMQSPEAWKKMMEAYAKSKTPLSPQEYAARLLRRSAMLPGQVGALEIGGED